MWSVEGKALTLLHLVLLLLEHVRVLRLQMRQSMRAGSNTWLHTCHHRSGLAYWPIRPRYARMHLHLSHAWVAWIRTRCHGLPVRHALRVHAVVGITCGHHLVLLYPAYSRYRQQTLRSRW